MDSSEGEIPASGNFFRIPRTSDFTGPDVCPSFHLHGIIEKQITGCLSVSHKQSHICLRRLMMGYHFLKIEISQYIGVMKQYLAICSKQTLGFKQASAGIKKSIAFVADGYVKSEIVIALKVINYLVGIMMNVDNDLSDV